MLDNVERPSEDKAGGFCTFHADCMRARTPFARAWELPKEYLAPFQQYGTKPGEVDPKNLIQHYELGRPIGERPRPGNNLRNSNFEADLHDECGPEIDPCS